ncbi:FAD-dependent oxidoreductase [Aggregatilinea lenta]|uniref:FAD-dependent oxidoreductase n=1 Tax=Aggregatilinea lenta TaxID=913108 RepID=UPI000E5B70C5|nr:FAD-dependent oxidoreductase [Aggregatilinea lenta]
MHLDPPALQREPRTEQIDCDLVIAGGGIAGTCCAITAARAGLRVTLIQDRPVLGGNASSEVRLWILGATAHMGNNNRWAREGGVIDELLVENMYRNPEGNALIFDTIVLEKVVEEPNIRLLLNTMVYEVIKSRADHIDGVRAFCSQNSTRYEARAPLFCDASGDGIVGFLSGAAFRMGAESNDEFGEKLAPSHAYGELLGHTLYFYSKDTGQPVTFVPPSFALTDITQIPRFHSFNATEYGARLWWIEYGGRLDTVHDTETIKWELWKVVYGVWNYVKNSGKFPEAETLTLEWVGHIPGKRESRRFEGAYMLRQQDLIEQRGHYDAVSFGGWALDLHPADGIYSEKPGCTQWHARGIYQIPYRTMYSRNIDNLFLAGRILSASHVAFASTRVQATLGSAAQAVGMAAVLCHRDGLLPADLSAPHQIKGLQRHLIRAGQHIPHVPLNDEEDLARRATISASSAYELASLPPSGETVALDEPWAQMLPVEAGRMPRVTLTVDAAEATTLQVHLRTSDAPDNYTPDVILAEQCFDLDAGAGQAISPTFDVDIHNARYVFVCLLRNPAVRVHTSAQRVTGVLSVSNTQNPAVSNYGKQEPGQDIGVETFEFWVPLRRPKGHNLAIQIDPPLRAFAPSNVANGWARPTSGPNAWVAALDDPAPCLTLTWAQPQTIRQIALGFDTDFDHPMESVLLGHPERMMPFCVRHYRITDGHGTVLAERDDNHQTRGTITLDEPVLTDSLTVEILGVHGDVPAAVFEVRCYS